MSEQSNTFRCSPDVLFQEVNGEIVLLDMKTETYFGLNKTGARVWQLLEEEASPESLTDRLLTEFEVDRVQLKTDVQLLIEELLNNELIQRA